MENSENVLAIHIGKLVKQHRKELNLTQDELAQRLNVHKSRVSWIERGLSLPQIGTLLSICKILKLPPTKFLLECFNVIDFDKLEPQEEEESNKSNDSYPETHFANNTLARLLNKEPEFELLVSQK